jgi:hypothetical protein
MGLVVLHRLDVTIDLRGDHASFTGDVSADHQHDTELTDRMRKAEHACGHEPRPGIRQSHAEKRIEGPRAECGRDLHGPCATSR